MKIKTLSERGQALIVIALAAVGLFAIVGLAIDGTTKFADQRHAQNAADTAALAGALARVNNDPDWKVKALDRAYENGYTGDLVNSTVEVYLCTEAGSSCGSYDDNPAFLQVIINSYINPTFARVVGVSQLHNQVQAVTYWNKRGPLYDGSLIVSLNPDPCTGSGANGNIALGTSGGGGNEAEISLTGGGAVVNSGGSGCGMEIMG
ncbi:MAG: hypothetical protein FIB03_07870 [Anaerolineae bacterium]|nr:hypothetical protein [Anaerolineae bacterium]